jgi:arylsulfatase A-like enzyme
MNTPDHRPNVLYIHSHDTGRYIQPYGFAVPTPNLQRFAEQGVLFRQAFCANPTCSASRASLLTGAWPHVNGMIGLAHRGSRLADPSRHLAAFLRRNGYETALSGVQHECRHEERAILGYEHLLDPPLAAGEDPNRAFARAAVEFLRRPHGRPFFLACGFGLTHRVGKVQWHNGPEPLGDARYVRPPLPLPDAPATRQDFADFTVAAGRLDRCMGEVFNALDAAGLAGNTLVVCTTDHGLAWPHMKCNLTDHGLGVMLMLRGPGGFEGGRVVDAIVSHVDVFPTLCDAAGLAPPPWLQGVSLRPLVDGRAAAVREEVFAEVSYHASYEPMRAVRTARYKYIRRFEPRGGPVLPNCDDSVSKRLLLEYGWARRPQAAEYLFDLVFDPNEACNLAGDPSYADPLADLRDRLDRWMRDTSDPLLAGRVRPWPGMVVNAPDGPSPQGPTMPAV